MKRSQQLSYHCIVETIHLHLCISACHMLLNPSLYSSQLGSCFYMLWFKFSFGAKFWKLVQFLFSFVMYSLPWSGTMASKIETSWKNIKPRINLNHNIIYYRLNLISGQNDFNLDWFVISLSLFMILNARDKEITDQSRLNNFDTFNLQQRHG